ncbi:MAG: glycosyl transferase group 1 [Bacteroidota bacterium]|nr:glycosyl transferase group 1 [Bacteroidota bacterium]
MKRRVLYVAMHRPNRSPSQRFRFEQYLGYLQQNGFDYDFSYLINAEDDKVFYQPGNTLNKGFIFLKAALKRLGDVLSANKYDIIFIQREAFMTGSVFFEKQFARSKAKVIFDFDDSIWLENVSEANKKFSFLKDASKTSKIIGMSDMIFAGNQYLADYAREFNENVVIIPTTIDTEEYRPPLNLPPKGRLNANSDDKICIGWSGSVTTIQHFKSAVPALLKVKEKYGDKISIKVIGDANYRHNELQVISKNWNKEDELKELSSFDIGLMPLPDDMWAKGKCGLKGLQYMALEIPTIMSPVGVNSDIIIHGLNGFLASTDNEYADLISKLIEEPGLRKKMAKAGRQTVIDHYSVASTKGKYLQHFNALVAPQ